MSYGWNHTVFSLLSLTFVTEQYAFKVPSCIFMADRSFLFVKSESAQSCLTLLDPMDCSPPGSSVHGILQARILEWVAIPFSRRSSQPRDQTQVSRIYFYCWVIFHYRDEPYSSIHLGPIFLTCKGRLSSSTLDSCHQMTQVQCSAWCPASHPLYLPSPTSFTLA